MTPASAGAQALYQLNVTRDGISKTAADAVRLAFNPSSLPEIERLKLLMGAWITEVEALKGRAAREAATAIINAQTASMWAVLAATVAKD